MNRGEVWWLEDAEVGRRPACILTRSEAIPVLTSVVVTLATTHVRGIDSEVRLGPEHGMPRPCALSLDNLRTAPKSILVERITTLRPPELARICLGLSFATGC